MLNILKEYKKKRDLSNKSSDEEALKKLREGSLDNSACSDVSVNNEDPFTEGLKSHGVCKHFNELYAVFRKAGWSDFQDARKDRGSSN